MTATHTSTPPQWQPGADSTPPPWLSGETLAPSSVQTPEIAFLPGEETRGAVGWPWARQMCVQCSAGVPVRHPQDHLVAGDGRW